MSRQPMIEMILDPRPLPTPRERQISWLTVNFAILADVPAENVSIVYADDAEAITVHIVCTCAERHMLTFTHWCTSEDDQYDFVRADGMHIYLSLEPFAGDL